MNKFLRLVLYWCFPAVAGVCSVAQAQGPKGVCEENLIRHPLSALEEHLAGKAGLDGFYNIRAYTVGSSWESLTQWVETAKAQGVSVMKLQMLGSGHRLRMDFTLVGTRENLLPVIRSLPLSSAYWIAGDLRESVPFEDRREIYLKDLSELDLSPLMVRLLNELDIFYVGELVSMTESTLLASPNIGEIRLGEIENALNEVGLKIGLRVVGWPPPDLPPVPMPDMSAKDLDAFLSLEIRHSPLSTYLKNRLIIAGFVYFGDIIAYRGGYIPGLADVSYHQLQEFFGRYGFRLRMKINGWPKNQPPSFGD